MENIDIDIDIDKDNLKNIDIDIDIDMAILENIDIDKGILQNINIDEILYRQGFGISNTPMWWWECSFERFDYFCWWWSWCPCIDCSPHSFYHHHDGDNESDDKDLF